MNFEKFNIVKLSNGNKIIILEKLEYNGDIYLYVDDVNEDETDTLDNYYIMKVNKNGSIKKEENIDTLTEIVPLFNRLVHEDYE